MNAPTDTRRFTAASDAIEATEAPTPAVVAQVVEHGTENPGVGGSIPPCGARSIPTLTESDKERFWSKVDTNVMGDACWQWLGSCSRSNGYACFWLQGETYNASRIAVILSGRELQPHEFALHTCDNPGCVRPSHLYPGTHAQNMIDRKVRNRVAKGNRAGASKLTADNVMAARERIATGETIFSVADDYDVTTTTLWRALNGRTWRHLKPQLSAPLLPC